MIMGAPFADGPLWCDFSYGCFAELVLIVALEIGAAALALLLIWRGIRRLIACFR